MQNVLKSLIFSSVLGLTLFSCNEPEVKQSPATTETNKTEIIDFRGEKITIPGNFPTAFLNQTPEEFGAYYEQLLLKANARTQGTTLTYDQIGAVIAKHSTKFPNLNSNMEISEESFEQIKKDIPTIETKEEALNKIDLIYSYYDALLKSAILPDIIKIEQSGSSNGRTNGPSPGNLTDAERNILIGNPGYAQHYVAASQDVNNLVFAVWGIDQDNKMNNAWKHATWNGLIIRYILQGSPASENQAINFAQNGTSAHEKELTGNTQIHSVQAAMDLHNNMSARVWMEQEIKWGIGPLRKMPSKEKIVEEMRIRATNGTFYNSNVDPNGAFSAILNLHGGNNQTTWNNLYNNLYGSYQHLVYIQ